MELLSLPDEMIANVLKYSNYVTTTELRKMNSRINNVAKSFEIGTRLPVKRMQCGLNGRGFDWGCDLFMDDSDLSRIKCPLLLGELKVCARPKGRSPRYLKKLEFKTKDGSYLNIVNNILSKIEVRGSLDMMSLFRDEEEKLFGCLQSNKKNLRNLTSLVMNTTNDCSATDFRDFFESTKKLRSIKIYDWNGDLDVILHSGIFENRPWKRITLQSFVDRPRPKLNDEFLLKVVKNCDYFHLMSDNSFTVEGIINLIKACVKENVPDKTIRMVRIQSMEALFEKAEQRIIESTKGLELQCTFTKYNDGPGVWKKANIYYSNNSSLIDFGLFDDTW